MLQVTPTDPFKSTPDPLPHFAPFFKDPVFLRLWRGLNAKRAENGDLFAPPNTGFHHNPMESDVSYLYLATSPNYPGEVKIGMSGNRPDQRLKNASSDIAFRKDPDVEIRAFFMIKNARAKDVESTTHKLLEKFRSDPVMKKEGRDATGEREWFAVSDFEALAAIELAARCYRDPKKIKHLSDLIKSGMDDLHTILLLDDLVPGFLEKQEYALTDEPSWKPEKAQQISDRFSRLSGASFGRLTKWKTKEREDIVFIPITPPPERYFWDYARWLIPEREKIMGADITELFPGISHQQVVRSLDASVPENQAFMRNGVVVGSMSSEGSINVKLSMDFVGRGLFDYSSEVLYETDLVNSPLMERITTLYWDIRNMIDKALPQFERPELPSHIHKRNTYLHSLSSSLVSLTPDDLNPRIAQILHTGAMSSADTPIDMCLCPVELCEIIAPLLREHGHSADARSVRYTPSPA
jgi:hypothetical protein